MNDNDIRNAVNRELRSIETDRASEKDMQNAFGWGALLTVVVLPIVVAGVLLYLFLMVGVFAIVAWVFVLLARSYPRRRGVVGVLAAVVLIPLGLATYQYTKEAGGRMRALAIQYGLVDKPPARGPVVSQVMTERRNAFTGAALDETVKTLRDEIARGMPLRRDHLQTEPARLFAPYAAEAAALDYANVFNAGTLYAEAFYRVAPGYGLEISRNALSGGDISRRAGQIRGMVEAAWTRTDEALQDWCKLRFLSALRFGNSPRPRAVEQAFAQVQADLIEGGFDAAGFGLNLTVEQWLEQALPLDPGTRTLRTEEYAKLRRKSMGGTMYTRLYGRARAGNLPALPEAILAQQPFSFPNFGRR